jgi:predicted ester cyclase
MSQLQHRLTHNGAVTSVGSAQTRMDQSTKSLAEIRACFVNELWNRRDLARADELFAPDCVTHQLSSRPGNIPTAPRGPEQIKHELTAWVQSFPDIAFAVEQAFEAGDCYVARYVVTGTHSGEWLGLPPTNRHVTMRMVHTVRVSDGQIVEDWLLADWYGMLEQLGVVPSIEHSLATAAASFAKSVSH